MKSTTLRILPLVLYVVLLCALSFRCLAAPTRKDRNGGQPRLTEVVASSDWIAIQIESLKRFDSNEISLDVFIDGIPLVEDWAVKLFEADKTLIHEKRLKTFKMSEMVCEGARLGNNRAIRLLLIANRNPIGGSGELVDEGIKAVLQGKPLTVFEIVGENGEKELVETIDETLSDSKKTKLVAKLRKEIQRLEAFTKRINRSKNKTDN